MKNTIEVSVKDIDTVQNALLVLKAISDYSQISCAEFERKYPDYKTDDLSLLWSAFSRDATEALERL